MDTNIIMKTYLSVKMISKLCHFENFEQLFFVCYNQIILLHVSCDFLYSLSGITENILEELTEVKTRKEKYFSFRFCMLMESLRKTVRCSNNFIHLGVFDMYSVLSLFYVRIMVTAF